MAEKILLYTQVELDAAIKEKCDALHEHYRKDYLECHERAKAAEDNAVKNIGLLQQSEQKVDELRGRVDRRNNTIVHLKAEIYDRDQLIANVLKGMVDCDELKSFIKVIKEA